MEDRQLSQSQSNTGIENVIAAPNTLFDRYSQNLQAVSDLLVEAGHTVAVFNPLVPSRFPELQVQKQIDIIESLESALRIYGAAIGGGISIKDNRQMAWWALRELSYRPTSDAFSHIEDRNVIEIYDENHKQVFRTLNFFPCLSYSLDEINTYEWWELYNRDEAVTQVMHKTVGEMMSRAPATIVKPFPTHWAQERFSERKNWAKIESKILTPITRPGNTTVVGYMNAFEVLELRKRRDV